MKNEQIKCYCGHTTYCDCGTLEEPELINNCPKCGLDLIEREGRKPVCREIDCKGIVLSNETLREWALALKKEPKEDVLAETPFHLPDFTHLNKTYTEQEVKPLLDAMQYFITRVDEGTIRSKTTYEMFKHVLKEFKNK